MGGRLPYASGPVEITYFCGPLDFLPIRAATQIYSLPGPRRPADAGALVERKRLYPPPAARQRSAGRRSSRPAPDGANEVRSESSAPVLGASPMWFLS